MAEKSGDYWKIAAAVYRDWRSGKKMLSDMTGESSGAWNWRCSFPGAFLGGCAKFFFLFRLHSSFCFCFPACTDKNATGTG